MAKINFFKNTIHSGWFYDMDFMLKVANKKMILQPHSFFFQFYFKKEKNIFSITALAYFDCHYIALKEINYRRAVQTEIHKDIIEQSKRGSSKAQYQLYQLYAKAMYNTSYRMMNNQAEAEDMLQEAFTEAFMKLDTFRYESTFGAWVKRIVVNRCINEIKRRKADLQLLDNMSAFDNKEDEEEIHAELSVAEIKRAMQELPEGSRVIFSLYLLEGYDHREIAQILNVSESNSKSQYMRAKKRIKEILEGNRYEN